MMLLIYQKLLRGELFIQCKLLFGVNFIKSGKQKRKKRSPERQH